MTLLGYQVENLQVSEPGKAAYKLHGPRATYTLFRGMKQPHMLFPINSKGNVCAVKGNGWFTDRKGTLDVAVVI